MHVNQQLWGVYLRSNPQQQAVSSLICELERVELLCDSHEREWRSFIDDFAVEALLYGYCVYQVRAGKPVVLPGRYVEIRRSRGRCVPRLLPNAPRDRLYKKGWRLLVIDEPQFNSEGGYIHPLSRGYKCMPQSVQRLVLERNLDMRDSANTVHTIYTRVANNIQAAPGTRPWFTHGALAGGVAGRVDLETLIDHRTESIQALDKVTARARDVTQTHAPGSRPVAPKQQHAELMISDGRDYTEARGLSQDAIIVHHTIDRLAFEIQFTMGVPPQVQGRNVNSERLAGSNRLNEQALSHFRCAARRLRLHLEQVFETAGTVRFGCEMNAHTLDQVGHLLKTKKLIKLYALANNLDVDDFDQRLVSDSRQHPAKRQKTDEKKLSAALTRTPKDG